FDPSVFVENITDKKDKDYDTGFRAYVFYGFQHSTAAELDQNNMYSVRPGTKIHDYFLPASSRYGEVRDPKGTEYPALYKGQNPGEFNFFEASSIRQVGNKYVMVFSGYSGPDYGLGSTNSALRYAYGDTPLGPWRSGGVLVDSRGVVLNEDGSKLITTNWGHNTHGSLQEINGQWYVFYHRPPRGCGFGRQAMVAPVKIVWDKKSVAKGGKVRIVGYDPYVKGNEWTAKASNGDHYTGAEVTSEGFQIFGLPPYNYYSAGIACYVTDHNALQDQRDVWNNSMDLAGLKNGSIVGFKYFGFGGLAKEAKGCNAFAGTKKGDGTRIQLDITEGSGQPYTIKVMLDGPYANSTWHGKEIGRIEVKDAKPGRHVIYGVRVPEVEGLTGKHGIYLVVEGPEYKAPEQPRWGNRNQQNARPQGLFDLHGLAFASDNINPPAPVVPKITIKADGQDLVIPSYPLLSTNQNGYTQTNHYQVYGRLTDKSVITATSSDPTVKVTVGKITDGRATVTAVWNGVEKVFLIN
ncbi:MAG: hypothetical protein MSA80_04710, partial [Prevotella sp.]|nr:hypothetical protein [Prevotella sp.]